MLRVSGLAAAYAGIEAVKQADVTVSAGEIVGLIGPNGAGKSTLLRCISGLVRPTKGTVSFDGEDITRLHPHRIARRGVLHVPEGRQILVDLSVEENLQLGTLARSGRPSPYAMRDVYRLFPVLEERKHQAGGTLSGGEQQMLAIGRALMGGPRLLLLDEPSLGLAPIVTDQLFEALRSLNADGLTILLVEQNAFRALHAAGRSYVLEQGRIVHHGPSADLLADQALVAHYLGETPGA